MSGQNGRDDAARLEAALDRIARAARPTLPNPRAEATNAGMPIPALAARLDDVIARLRAVLGADA